MGERTSIAWCDHTFNPWWGCEKVSDGCRFCYAEAFDRRTFGNVAHPTPAGVREPHWGGAAPRRFFGQEHWDAPRAWDRAAGRAGVHRKVFCSSMADVWEDRSDLIESRARLFGLIQDTQNLTWLLLTKRPQNILRLWPSGFAAPGMRAWPNVWHGTTVENRAAKARIPMLVEVPAMLRFLSVEPQLEDITPLGSLLDGIDWVIEGGESGQSARPYQLAWPRALRDECADRFIAWFHKQLGDNVHGDWGDDTYPRVHVTHVGGGPDTVEPYRRKNGRWHLSCAGGALPSEWPADLRIQQFPEQVPA